MNRVKKSMVLSRMKGVSLSLRRSVLRVIWLVKLIDRKKLIRKRFLKLSMIFVSFFVLG